MTKTIAITARLMPSIRQCQNPAHPASQDLLVKGMISSLKVPDGLSLSNIHHDPSYGDKNV